jgi:aspartate/tyrosine/aromatic aminotransferase
LQCGGIQVLSGTGALRTVGEFVQDFVPNKDIYISKPTWGNHRAIFNRCGLNVKEYTYYKPATRGLDFEGFMADLEGASDGSTFVLHACAHNPTGVDPNMEQWAAICAVCKAKDIFVVFDSAYQGFASGDPAVDAGAMRHFASEGVPLTVCQSFSKNFGLYNERAGCLLVCAPTKAAREAIESQLKIIVRANWSNPPAHGARIVAGARLSPAVSLLSA